jgi:hypothetical protein
MAGVSQASPLSGARQRAQALSSAGDKAGAVALLEHAVALGKVNLGEDHPDVLSTAHQLARLHHDRGDPAAARRVLEEAYAAGQWRLGDADPVMLEISYDLGAVAEEMGNRHEARKALTRVVEAGRPVLGDLHWAVQRAQLYLDGDTNAVTQDSPPTTTCQPLPPLPRRRTGPIQEGPIQEGPIQEAPRVQEPGPVQQGLPDVRPEEWTEPAWQKSLVQRRQSHRDDLARRGGLTNLHLHDRRDPDDEVTVFLGALPQRDPPAPAPGAGTPMTPPPAYQKRGPALFAAIAAVLAAVIAVAALVFVLADRGREPADRGREPTAPDVPTLTGAPPADVKLRDFGSSVQLGWTDTGAARNSFILTGGHPGEALKPMGEVGPGATSFELHGLNARWTTASPWWRSTARVPSPVRLRPAPAARPRRRPAELSPATTDGNRIYPQP